MNPGRLHLADIRVHPVKSLRGASHQTARIQPWGLDGDRRWLVVDDAGRFLTQRQHPNMATIEAEQSSTQLTLRTPGGTVTVAQPGEDAETIDVTVWSDIVPARLAAAAAALLTEAIGETCRLAWMHDPRARAANPAYAPAGTVVNFADAYPVLLASAASLADLNERLTTPIPITRFRPNLVVDGAAAYEEDRWRTIRIGEVTFAVVKPCDRCLITTIDPDSGTRPDKTEPLRTLARYRRDRSGKVLFGQNLVPLSEGTIHAGDPVTVIETGPSNAMIVSG